MDKTLSKIRKLLALADDRRNANEAERTAAALKVQELLQEHNLTLAAVGDAADEAPRAVEVLNFRAMYEYQRTLMATIAKTHFCFHRVSTVFQPNDKSPYVASMKANGRWSKRHQLVGRRLNVDATALSYEYLLEAIERAAGDAGYDVRTSDGKRFLDGAATRVAERLEERRRQRERESHAAATAIDATRNALVLSDVYGTEDDLNNDALNGFPAGTTATRNSENARHRAEVDARWRALQEDGIPKWEAWYLSRGYDAATAKEAGTRFQRGPAPTISAIRRLIAPVAKRVRRSA